MLKPNRLKKGNRVAIVSLSKGMLGEEKFIHILDIARARLEGNYGLKVTVVPHALEGISWLYDHPEARAEDLMNAFRDKSAKAVICAIGEDRAAQILLSDKREITR